MEFLQKSLVRHANGRELAAASYSFWAAHITSDLTAATPLLVTSDVVMFTVTRSRETFWAT